MHTYAQKTAEIVKFMETIVRKKSLPVKFGGIFKELD